MRSSVKAGGIRANHSQGVAVKTAQTAGGLAINHNQAGVAVKSSVRAGGFRANHNQGAR